MSTFDKPSDLFKIQGRAYSVHFLSYILRYCLLLQYVGSQGEEPVVELGLGSCYQIEILKRLNPRMPILCCDLPAQNFCVKLISRMRWAAAGLSILKKRRR